MKPLYKSMLGLNRRKNENSETETSPFIYILRRFHALNRTHMLRNVNCLLNKKYFRHEHWTVCTKNALNFFFLLSIIYDYLIDPNSFWHFVSFSANLCKLNYLALGKFGWRLLQLVPKTEAYATRLKINSFRQKMYICATILSFLI